MLNPLKLKPSNHSLSASTQSRDRRAQKVLLWLHIQLYSCINNRALAVS